MRQPLLHRRARADRRRVGCRSVPQTSPRARAFASLLKIKVRLCIIYIYMKKSLFFSLENRLSKTSDNESCRVHEFARERRTSNDFGKFLMRKSIIIPPATFEMSRSRDGRYRSLSLSFTSPRRAHKSQSISRVNSKCNYFYSI